MHKRMRLETIYSYDMLAQGYADADSSLGASSGDATFSTRWLMFGHKRDRPGYGAGFTLLWKSDGNWDLSLGGSNMQGTGESKHYQMQEVCKDMNFRNSQRFQREGRSGSEFEAMQVAGTSGVANKPSATVDFA